jgi:hypothetical protein
LQTVEEEENANLTSTMSSFESYFSFLSEFVSPFINEVAVHEEVEVQQTKGKESKKPGKVEQVLQKEIKKSGSGIESLVLLLDRKL